MSKRLWSERAKERLRVLDLSQAELARRAGLTPGAVGHYLAGRRHPPKAMFAKLAHVLGVDPEWLAQGKNPPAIPDTLGGRIAYARKQRGMSIWQLARQMHQDVETVKQWENNTAEPSSLDVLAGHLAVSLNWLLKGVPMPEDTYVISNVSPAGPVKLVPVIGWASAGHWREAIQALPEDCEMVPVIGNCSGHFGLRVDGDSMVNPNPGGTTFLPGTIIILDPDKRPDAGHFVVAIDTVHNDAVFKQYVRDGRMHYLKPLNPQYHMIEMTNDYEVCGVVVSSVQRYT